MSAGMQLRSGLADIKPVHAMRNERGVRQRCSRHRLARALGGTLTIGARPDGTLTIGARPDGTLTIGARPDGTLTIGARPDGARGTEFRLAFPLHQPPVADIALLMTHHCT